MEYVSLHKLRHSYASILASQGVQIRNLMSQLGHSEIKMSMELYAHALEDVKKSEIVKINDTFKGVVKELKVQGM